MRRPTCILWANLTPFSLQCPTSLPEDAGDFPNAKNVALHRPSWEILVVKDVSPPPPVAPEFAEMVADPPSRFRPPGTILGAPEICATVNSSMETISWAQITFLGVGIGGSNKVFFVWCDENP
jgi:hypothetical protein